MRIFLRNSLFATLSAFMLVTLSGCQGGGLGDITNPMSGGGKKYEAAYLKQNLIPGKTTKDQVLQMFGTPHDESASSSNGSNEVNWIYEKSQEPSLDKYLNVAQKYVSTDTFWKINNAKVEANKGQDVMNDVNTVTGNKKTMSSGAVGSRLSIYFQNNVVDHYYLN
ncbi:hypothetical protein [uncultured Pseudomonas sp.]|uniref:hypothetical protein n=1 Tax=uncultured Pseudomonas sp. TaxID=114707 RepID=UPI0025E9DF6C|nr:hypothetical protein [uncultured Pseudomonas sp.]